MEINEFISSLKMNNYKTTNILHYLNQFNLNNYRTKRIVLKKMNEYFIGGGDGTNGKINNLEEFIFSDTKFISRLIHGDATDIKGKTHTIKFVSLDDIHENSVGCATLNFDYEKKTAYIQSLGDYGNCVFCPTHNVNFKVGQILMLMILTLCKEKKNIKTIELTDISTFNCFNTFNKKDEYIGNSQYKMHDNFDLKILSTLLKGFPYYCKYGFEPKSLEDKEILKHNIKVYNKHIILNTINLKDNIQKYLSELKIIKNNQSDKYFEIVNKYVIPTINNYANKPIDEFIYHIININPENHKDKIILCNIIISFYKKIFESLGYKKFIGKIFIKKNN